MFNTYTITLYTKISKWLNNIIFKEDFEKIKEYEIKELFEYFKNMIINPDIRNFDNLVDAEFSIKENSFFYINSIIHYLSGDIKKFFKNYIKKYEIENLKIYAKYLLTGKPLGKLYETEQSSRIKYELMKDIKTLDDLLNFLSGTIYYRPALDSFDRIKEENNTFFFEINLENLFCLNLKKSSEKLNPVDKEIIEKYLFNYIQIKRIIWIYRCLFNYKLNFEETLSLIPNVFNIISKIKYDNLLKSQTKEEFIENLKKISLYKNEGLENFEKNINKNFIKRIRIRKTSPFNLKLLIFFIIISEYDIKNKICILESSEKRYTVKDLYVF